MKPTLLYLARLPESTREICQQAAHEAFPQAECLVVRSVEEAAARPAVARELLVLGRADEAESNHAAQLLDAHDLPRWAVVHLGRTPSELVDTVLPEDWQPRTLARIFRASLLQHELLRENLQLRGDLKTIARRITHDVRTPLGCILTICEALKDPTARHALPLEEAVEAIRSANGELTELADQVSLVLKASLEPPVPQLLTLEPILAHVLEEQAGEIARSAHKIRPPQSWPEVTGVATWLEFIWKQLLRHALQASARPGVVQLGWTEQDAFIRFWINSPGVVPPTQRSRLLQPFHLLHKHASADLGLSLVARLVALQGGECGYEPTGDGRSLLSFTLPTAHSSEGEPVTAATRAAAL